jgi:hypothetical protein
MVPASIPCAATTSSVHKVRSGPGIAIPVILLLFLFQSVARKQLLNFLLHGQ